MVSTIEQAKVILYANAAEDFVSERDRLVKEVRSGGDRELAAAIKALRRPSAIAAEVNRVVRANPDGVALILQAADLLRSAQSAAADAESTDQSAADLQQQYRAAIAALAQTADSRRAEVRSALEAATIAVESNDDLRTGSLAVIPRPIAAFGIIDQTRSTDEPVDELAERRARKKSEQATAPDKASQKKRAKADAEKARRAEQERHEKERERERRARRKQLTKDHSAALRVHLQAIEAEEKAHANEMAAETIIVDLDDEIVSLQQALDQLTAKRADALSARVEAEQDRSQARDEVARRADHVQSLADAIAALDD